MPRLLDEYVLAAVAIVSASDIPDNDFCDAVNAEARYLAGVQSDDLWAVDSDTPTQ